MARKDSPTMDMDLTSGRRAVLLGGAGVFAAAFLAACGDDTSVSSGATAGPTTTPPAPDPARDLALSMTFASLEVMMIDTYQAILDAGSLTTPAVLGAAKMFLSHHEQHLDAINDDVTGGGEPEVTERNSAVYDELVAPKLAAATSERAAAELLADLEHAMAQTYTWSGGTEGFTTPDLRKKSATIAGVDARHEAVLIVVGAGQPPVAVFPQSFFPATNPLADIKDAMLSPTGG